MQNWWESLSPLLQVLYCIAVPSTLILVLQMLLTMLGGHNDSGVDVSDTSGIDMDADTMSLDLNGNGIPDVLESSDLPSVADGGNPADFGSLRLLTMQTVITFLTVFSWVTIICVSAGLPGVAGGLIGAVCGIVMMLVVARMVQMSRKLVENGAIVLRNAIGETASVYVPVPGRNDGTGKITMQLQGRFCEFDAVNSGDAPLPTGAQVLVVDVVGDTLVVEAAE